jgi:hypothetical protein
LYNSEYIFIPKNKTTNKKQQTKNNKQKAKNKNQKTKNKTQKNKKTKKQKKQKKQKLKVAARGTRTVRVPVIRYSLRKEKYGKIKMY